MKSLKYIASIAALSGTILAGSAAIGTASAVTLCGSVGFVSGSNRGDILAIDQIDATIYSTISNPTTNTGISGLGFDNSGHFGGLPSPAKQQPRP
jgi:hypothetical protein